MDSPPLPQNWGPGADLKGEMREIKALVIQALQLSPAAKPCVGGQQELDKISGQAERARWWPSVGREAGLLAGAVLPSGQSEPIPQRQPDGHIPCAQAQRRLLWRYCPCLRRLPGWGAAQEDETPWGRRAPDEIQFPAQSPVATGLD